MLICAGARSWEVSELVPKKLGFSRCQRKLFAAVGSDDAREGGVR